MVADANLPVPRVAGRIDDLRLLYSSAFSALFSQWQADPTAGGNLRRADDLQRHGAHDRHHRRTYRRQCAFHATDAGILVIAFLDCGRGMDAAGIEEDTGVSSVLFEVGPRASRGLRFTSPKVKGRGRPRSRRLP